MNKLLTGFLCLLCLTAEAQTENLRKAPSAPFIIKPASAHWFQLPPTGAQTGKDSIVRTEYWLRGNDYKQVTTYASGRTVTLVSIGGFGIYSDSEQKLGSISYLSALNVDASEEQKFADGYANLFQLLNWVSDKTFARTGTYKTKEVFIYERSLAPSQQEMSPILCAAYIDAETLFPLACSFGERVYSFDGLETNITIPDSVFAIPNQVAPQWEEHQKELARQDRLRRINSGGQ